MLNALSRSHTYPLKRPICWPPSPHESPTPLASITDAVASLLSVPVASRVFEFPAARKHIRYQDIAILFLAGMALSRTPGPCLQNTRYIQANVPTVPSYSEHEHRENAAEVRKGKRVGA